MSSGNCLTSSQDSDQHRTGSISVLCGTEEVLPMWSPHRLGMAARIQESLMNWNEQF